MRKVAISIYVIIALLVLVATFFILRYTRFGRSLYAVGDVYKRQG